MKHTNKLPALLLCALLLLPAYGRAQPKLLNFSNYGPDTRMLLNQYTSWESTSPYDGLSVIFLPNNINTGGDGYLGGKNVPGELTLSVFKAANTINYADYQHAIDDMKACTFSKFKNNFIMLALFEQNWIPWNDAVNWGKMIANLGVAAKIADSSGLKGIVLDTETYGPDNINLLLYSLQVPANGYALTDANNRLGLGRIDEVTDAGNITDLFPRTNQNIYWWDNSTNLVNGTTTVTRENGAVFKDLAGNFYYLLLDPAHQTDVEQVIVDVKQRGAEMINAINANFPDAEVILTVAPSDIHYDFSTAYGMNENRNFQRTASWLLVPLTEGMLEAAVGTRIKLIDGQEQTYYLKNRSSFMNGRTSFDKAEQYYSSTAAKSLYRNNMLRAYGLYSRSVNNPEYNPLVNTAYRFFSPAELQDQYKYASEFPDIRYIWQWEEKESIWLNDVTALHKYDNINPTNKYGLADATNYITAINNGQNALKNFVVHDNEFLYLKGTEVTGKNILVEQGGTLRFRDSFSLSGAHSVTFDDGAYCCMETGLKLKLDGYHSFVNFVPGYQVGVKSPLLDGGNCAASPTTTITVTGKGAVNTIDRDVYIQNETLTGDQYIVGKNIQVGYNVALPARTNGAVQINGNANIRFKAGEKVNMTRDVNIETGSTYLTK